jgi:hypothetical protein
MPYDEPDMKGVSFININVSIPSLNISQLLAQLQEFDDSPFDVYCKQLARWFHNQICVKSTAQVNR